MTPFGQLQFPNHILHIYISCLLDTRYQHPLDETHLDAVRVLIEPRGFHPSTSTSGARRSDAPTSDKDKQICFVLLPRT